MPGFSVTEDRTTILQVRSTPRTSGEVVQIAVESGEIDVLDEPNAEYFMAQDIGPWERITIERTGQRWTVGLLPPEFDETKQYPLVLDIHGGPDSRHGPGFNAPAGIGRRGIRGPLHRVARLLQLRPLLYAGGRRRLRPARIYLDQMAFLDEICRWPYIDAERIGVYGCSYGGYMTSSIVGHTDRFKAAVIGAPVVDLVSFYGTADIGHTFGPLQIGGTPMGVPRGIPRPVSVDLSAPGYDTVTRDPWRGGRPRTDRAGRAVLHDAQGSRCVTDSSRYPGEAHAMLRTGLPAHRYDYHTRVVAWFETYLTHQGAARDR